MSIRIVVYRAAVKEYRQWVRRSGADSLSK